MKLESASVARDGSSQAEAGLTRDDRALLLRYMLLMRLAEERA